LRRKEPLCGQESLRGEEPVCGPQSLRSQVQVSIDPSLLPEASRVAMAAASDEVRACQRALAQAGLNVVGEVLRGQGDFVEFDHYPSDDVFDRDSHSQYYYHAHRGETAAAGGQAEHGHFHLFLRAPGMPAGCRPIAYPQATDDWPKGDEAISHLVAISMDEWGMPIGLFCTNRWVTAEAWYPAEQVIAMLDHFSVDHASPNWAVNRWISAMVRLCRPHIEFLLRQRDRVIADWRGRHPGEDVFEDRALEITGHFPISIPDLIEQLQVPETRT
jgi:hypothetical protein